MYSNEGIRNNLCILLSCWGKHSAIIWACATFVFILYITVSSKSRVSNGTNEKPTIIFNTHKFTQLYLQMNNHFILDNAVQTAVSVAAVCTDLYKMDGTVDTAFVYIMHTGSCCWVMNIAGVRWTVLFYALFILREALAALHRWSWRLCKSSATHSYSCQCCEDKVFLPEWGR